MAGLGQKSPTPAPGGASARRPYTTGTLLKVLLLLGAVGAASRFLFGLGATTNLNDGYPWGLWISFDVLTGVALAAGGFTISATVYVFNLKSFEPLLRPAKVSAFVGYLMVVIGLFFDLGLPWRLWHPLMMWNPQSVLFEVAWCVMLYTAVLGVDVVILVLERLGKERSVRTLRSVYIFLIVAGLVLSTLHQSSLGALYLVIPQKMSELWASRALGPLFYASAVVAGLSVVILESLLTARARAREPEMGILSSLAKGLAAALLVYFAMKVTDLYARGVETWRLDLVHLFFYAELFGTVLLPAALLGLFPEVRRSRAGLLACAGLSAFGVALNRFNVSLIGYAGYADFAYFPSFVELVVTVGLIALGLLTFDLAAHYLPVYGRPPSTEAGGELARQSAR
jgi:Ni/Fe-hydrogenase subunit HybB-like protein